MATTTFISLIKDGMKICGLSLREVARIVEVDPSYLSKILAGKRTPPNDEKILKHIADVLDLDPLRLIISTGGIPSEWQAKMEEEIVINELSRFFRGGGLSYTAMPSFRRKPESRKADVCLDSRASSRNDSNPKKIDHLHKPKELSEDLL